MASTIIRRKDALAQGLRRYFTGKPCKAGHVAERFTNGNCVACEPAKVRQYGWSKKNPERHLEHCRRAAEKFDRDKRNAITRNYRAKKRLAGGTHTAEDIAEIFKLQRGRCAYCKKKLGKKYDVDHIKPVAKGGSNHRRNLQLTCPTCNHKKNDKSLPVKQGD
jgi:5-methylcytosine-specific restriction endonuclease McrA